MPDFNVIPSVIFEDVNGEKRSFKSFKTLTAFLESEKDFWADIHAKFDNPITLNLKKKSQQALSIIKMLNIDESIIDNEDFKNAFDQKIGQIATQLISISFSNTPFSNVLVEIAARGPQQTQAFWSYITQRNNKSIDSLNHLSFEGYLLGYEFCEQGHSKITNRKKAEIEVIGALRKQYTDMIEETTVATANLEDSQRVKFGNIMTEISDWKSIFETNTNNELTDTRKRFEELELTYKESLKLKKPAEYWNNKAREFKTSGRCWGALLVATTVSTITLFTWLFIQWLTVKEGNAVEKFTSHHWQGIILLVAVLSLSAFLIRVFGKLTFSSFHLQRDAEEREQLAYLYLALTHEAEIDVEERKIVLQSLFSRSETGLLTGDHGPTMPGISDAIGKKMCN